MAHRDVATTSVWLIVCGERERGDDAAGPIAIDGLPLDLLASCELRMDSGLSVETIVDIPPGVACVLVDAALGIDPGAVVTCPLGSLAARGGSGARTVSPSSSHVLAVDQVLGLAEIVRGELPDGTFVGIGAAGADIGSPLSPAVEDGLPAFRDAIAGAVLRHLAPS
jgi:hydrogenase maturation protease